MKCPKCGYTSYDYLDRCKNCGEDLVPAKIKLNIYTRSPEIEVGNDGFVFGKVKGDQRDLLGSDEPATNVSMDDVLSEGNEQLESFDFDDDKTT